MDDAALRDPMKFAEIHKQELSVDVREALERLTPLQARAIMYHQAGCTHEEIGPLLKISAKKSQRLCEKAREQLRADLKAYL